MSFKIGDVIKIIRKPFPGEPLAYSWVTGMDFLIGLSGKVLSVAPTSTVIASGAILIDVVRVEIILISTYYYNVPGYCCLGDSDVLTQPLANSCTCKTGTLMVRGCLCGAFKKEKK